MPSALSWQKLGPGRDGVVVSGVVPVVTSVSGVVNGLVSQTGVVVVMAVVGRGVVGNGVSPGEADTNEC